MKFFGKSVIAATVCYETTELIKRSVSSIKRFYPDLPIFIVDGSAANSACYRAVNMLGRRYSNITIHHALFNIGHGNGLAYAINNTESDYIITFDSDVEMLRGGVIELMVKALGDKSYGCGQIIMTNDNGQWQNSKGIVKNPKVKMLHPNFALINRSKYIRLKPITNHGAPFIGMVLDAESKGMYPIEFKVGNFVKHHWRGTRRINPTWDKQL